MTLPKLQSHIESEVNDELTQLMISDAIPKSDLLANLGLFIRQKDLTQLLFLSEIYQQILSVHGIIAEFGVRWGRNLGTFVTLRETFEHVNMTRKIVGFDTFEGFPSISGKDGDKVAVGEYATGARHSEVLSRILELHEQESKLSHLRRFELVKGDVEVTLKKYVKDHPETVFALCYLDLDLYSPTKCCLEIIRERITKGSIIVFDEILHPSYPGETLALKEVLGLDKYSIRRSPISGWKSYIVVE